MPRKGENIYKRKDGRWEGRYIKGKDSHGKLRYGYIYGKTYTAVREELHKRQPVEADTTPQRAATPCTFKTMLNIWLGAQRPVIKESTYARYYHIVTAHIVPEMGDITVDRITTQMIEDYTAKLLVEGRLDGRGGLSSKTVSDILMVVKSTIEYGKKHDYSVHCDLGRHCIKQSQKKMRVLSHTEQQKLTEHLLVDTGCVEFGVLLSLYTGIRIGELCALKWENLDLVEGVLYVRSTMQRVKNIDKGLPQKTRIIETNPKSKCSIREIPLPPFIKDLAISLQQQGGAYVLTGKNDKYIEPRTLQNKFCSFVKSCGVEKANYHSLRHTFATRCVELGFDIKTLSEILGHSSVTITLNRYVHSSMSLKRENMGKISATIV